MVSKTLKESQISFLNNLLLAIYYSRISLAVLSLTLKQSICLLFKVFCSSLRYSIYKVHPATLPQQKLRSSDSLHMIPLQKPFVNRFFRKILWFFCCFFGISKSCIFFLLLPQNTVSNPFVNAGKYSLKYLPAHLPHP